MSPLAPARDYLEHEIATPDGRAWCRHCTRCTYYTHGPALVVKDKLEHHYTTAHPERSQ